VARTLHPAAALGLLGLLVGAAGVLLRAARMRLALDQRGEALVLVQEAQGLARNDPLISRQVRAALQALQAPEE